MAEYATTIDIDAPPEIVFDHLVTVDGMLAWMGQKAELDPRPGGLFSVDIDGNPIRGEFVEVDRPRSVIVTWGLEANDVLPAGSTQVAFLLTPTATGTRLDLTHSGLPESQVAPHAEGWPHFLGILTKTAASAAA